MTVRRQYLIAMVFVVVLSVAITAGISTWIVDNQFETYVESEYEKRIEEVQDFALRYLRGEITESSGALKASVLKQLGSPVEGFSIYNADGASVLSAQAARGRRNPMGNGMMHHMGGGNLVTDSYELKDGDTLAGVIEIYRSGEITATENIGLFKMALRRGTMLAMFFVIIAAALFSVVLSNRLTKDLRNTAQIAGRMHSGDLESEDEKNSKVLEVREIQETLRSLGSKLKLQDRIRRERVDQLSHEVRTPLAVLQTNLEGALDEVLELDGPRIIKCLSEVRNLTGLFEDLDRVIDVEAQAIKVHTESLDIAHEVRDLMDAMGPVLGTKQQTVRYKGPDKLQWMMDAGLFKQILYNLISNSYKYSPESTEILVELEGADEMRLSVADQGPGLDGVDLQRIFEPYYRGSQSGAVKGTGLGLYIVKNAVEALSGKIIAETGEPEGAVFTVTFPKEIKR